MNQKLLVVVAIISFTLGFLSSKEFLTNQHKKVVKNEKFNYELRPEKKEVHQQIADVKSVVKEVTLSDLEALSKQFYTYLVDCEPLNVVSSNGYEMYIIEGINGDKCHFKHCQVGFVDTICNLPMDVTKKYASEGLEEIRQLEELRSQNKTGFVQGSEYINEINNDKNYCRTRLYEHNKP